MKRPLWIIRILLKCGLISPERGIQLILEGEENPILPLEIADRLGVQHGYIFDHLNALVRKGIIKEGLRIINLSSGEDIHQTTYSMK